MVDIDIPSEQAAPANMFRKSVWWRKARCWYVLILTLYNLKTQEHSTNFASRQQRTWMYVVSIQISNDFLLIYAKTNFHPDLDFEAPVLLHHQWARGNHHNSHGPQNSVSIILNFSIQWAPSIAVIGWKSSRYSVSKEGIDSRSSALHQNSSLHSDVDGARSYLQAAVFSQALTNNWYLSSHHPT